MLVDLANTPISEVLLKLSVERRSGDLVVRHNKLVKTVFFDHGRLVFASSNLKKDRLGEGLVALGRITGEQLQLASSLMRPRERERERRRTFGDALVEAGVMDKGEVGTAVARQVRQIVLSLFALPGSASFDDRPCVIPLEYMVALSLHQILYIGIKSIADEGLVLTGLGDRTRVVRTAPVPPFKFPLQRCSVVEREILEAARPSTLEQLATADGLLSPHRARAVYALLASGVLDLTEESGPEAIVQSNEGGFLMSPLHLQPEPSQLEALRQEVEQEVERSGRLEVEAWLSVAPPDEVARAMEEKLDRFHAMLERAGEDAELRTNIEIILGRGFSVLRRVRAMSELKPPAPATVAKEPAAAAPAAAKAPTVAATVTPPAASAPTAAQAPPAAAAPTPPATSAPTAAKAPPVAATPTPPATSAPTAAKAEAAASVPAPKASPAAATAAASAAQAPAAPIAPAPVTPTAAVPAAPSAPAAASPVSPDLTIPLTALTPAQIQAAAAPRGPAATPPTAATPASPRPAAASASEAEAAGDEIPSSALVEVSEAPPATPGPAPAAATEGPSDVLAPDSESEDPAATMEVDRALMEGDVRMAISDYASAVDCYERLVELRPRVAAYRLKLAIAMACWPRTAKQAERQFLDALRLRPNDATLHFQFGLYYKAMRQRARALIEMRTALSLEPSHPEARRELEVLSPKDSALTSIKKLLR